MILSVSSFACSVLQINSKPAFGFGQAVNLIQSKPKLAIQVTETMFCSRSSLGRNQPSRPVFFGALSTPTGCCLVTEHIRRHLHHQGRLQTRTQSLLMSLGERERVSFAPSHVTPRASIESNLLSLSPRLINSDWVPLILSPDL